jgi:hypothetical protein
MFKNSIVDTTTNIGLHFHTLPIKIWNQMKTTWVHSIRAFLFTGEISPKGEIKYQKIDYEVFFKVFNRQK